MNYIFVFGLHNLLMARIRCTRTDTKYLFYRTSFTMSVL